MTHVHGILNGNIQYLCTHTHSLTHSLTQARNLVYMVQRRERLKKRILDSHLQILEKEAGLGGEEADKVEEEEEEEMETQQPSRQTRYDRGSIMSCVFPGGLFMVAFPLLSLSL